MNKYYLDLLTRLVVTLHCLFARRNVFFDGRSSPLFWQFKVCRNVHFPQFNTVPGPFEIVRVPVA